MAGQTRRYIPPNGFSRSLPGGLQSNHEADKRSAASAKILPHKRPDLVGLNYPCRIPLRLGIMGGEHFRQGG
jgi:hypothetical protein